ncbi:poly-gamma-glutamate hydrolase family protein [Dactylosporangium salmoneum]|uniref:Phage-related replication protein n=1 Tax=Dactylosporangium salmoneum TaxID=53361 RepID=A0ABP5SBI9_9ACTN
MPPPYSSYAALAAEQTVAVDYTITSSTPTGATWASISIHGGAIERGSGEMAQEVASRIGAAYYQFAGIKSSGNSDLHITSTLFDEPTGRALVAASRRTLSFHGFAGTVGVKETALGGLDEDLKARVAARLTAAGFDVGAAPSEISGSNPANICNLNQRSAGVQLEMSNALRASFVPGNSTGTALWTPGARTDDFYRYAAAVAAAYDGQGMVAQSSVNVSRYCLLTAPAADVHLVATVATDALATGGSHFVALVARYAGTGDMYLARLDFSATQTVTLTLRKRVGGTETLLATAPANGLTHAAGRRFGIGFEVAGSTLRARTWLAAGVDPGVWQVQATDSDLTAAGSIGMRSILSTSNTNTLPVVASWDGFRTVGRQTLLVGARGVNGVFKAHSAGSPVHVAAAFVLS